MPRRVFKFLSSNVPVTWNLAIDRTLRDALADGGSGGQLIASVGAAAARAHTPGRFCASIRSCAPVWWQLRRADGAATDA
eukprot:gene30809-36833_t